jgi:hypothetical protein
MLKKNYVQKIDIQNNEIVFSQKKDYFDYVTPVAIPVLLLYVAWQQWQTSEKTRKQNLFDKRYKILDIFEELSNFCYFTMLRLDLFISEVSKKKNALSEKKFLNIVNKGKDCKNFIWDKDGYLDSGYEFNLGKFSELVIDLDRHVKMLIDHKCLGKHYSFSKKMLDTLDVLRKFEYEFKNKEVDNEIGLKNLKQSYEDFRSIIMDFRMFYEDSISLEKKKPTYYNREIIFDIFSFVFRFLISLIFNVITFFILFLRVIFNIRFIIKDYFEVIKSDWNGYILYPFKVRKIIKEKNKKNK